MGLRGVGCTRGTEFQLRGGAKVEDLTLEGGAPVCMQGGGEYQRKLVCLVLGVSSHVQTTPQAWAGPEAWTQASVPPGDVS